MKGQKKMKNKEILLEHLRDMDEFAQLKNLSCPPIYLLGGSACILGGYINRATTDFDFIDIDYPANSGRLFKMLERFDMLDYYVTPLPPDFRNRAKKLNGFEIIEIYVLSKEDIIVSKLSRYSEKDLGDIRQLIATSDKNLIEKLIEDITLRTDFSEKVKEYFIRNSKLFLEEFDV
jgi:hypothetical protein